MNPRCPTVVLKADECSRIRVLVREKGEASALDFFGLRTPETLYRAAAEQPIARLTAEVIRGRLDRI